MPARRAAASLQACQISRAHQGDRQLRTEALTWHRIVDLSCGGSDQSLERADDDSVVDLLQSGPPQNQLTALLSPGFNTTQPVSKVSEQSI